MRAEAQQAEVTEAKLLTSVGMVFSQSNSDMNAARNLFVANKGVSSEPSFLEFGNTADLYGAKQVADGTLLAQATQDKQNGDSTEVQKTISGADVVKTAEKLGHDPHRWESSTTGKCNVFLDAALRKSGVPLPWDAAHIPDSHGMRVALDKACQDPNSGWEKIYTYDSANDSQSNQRFTQYNPNNADVVIWDKVWGDKYVQHCCITEEPYTVLYAGARDPRKHGFGKTDLSNFTTAAPYGAPSAVYRYKGVE